MLDTLLLVMEQEPVAPRSINDKVPADLETICLTCLKKDPAKRYTTAAALADDLDRFLADEPIQARPAGLVERVNRWLRKHQGLVIAYIVTVTVALLVLAMGWMPSLAQNREEELALLMVVPMFGVFLRLVLLANMRWALATLVPLGGIGLLLSLLPPIRDNPLLSLLIIGSLLGLLAFLAGFIRARGWWDFLLLLLGYAIAVLPAVFGFIVAAVLGLTGVLREFSFSSFAKGLSISWFQLAAYSLVLGVFARIVAWGLQREAGSALLGGLIGALTGVILVDWNRESFTSYLGSVDQPWSPAGVTVYLTICLGYFGTLIGGLLAPAQRPAGDQVVPSQNNTRTNSTSKRAVPAGKRSFG